MPQRKKHHVPDILVEAMSGFGRRREDVEAAAERCGYAVSTLQAWIYGARKPSLTAFIDLAESQGYTVRLEKKHGA